MKTVWNIGLCGFGFMGKTHACSLSALPYLFGADLSFSARIAGLVTRHPEKAESICETYGFTRAYADAESMIKDPTIQVIDIATPNISHFDLLGKSLEAGKHIYCEKPLCMTLDQARQIRDLAALHPECRCAVVSNNRFMAPILRAKQLIDEGKIGRLLSFSFSYLHDSCADPEKPAGWKQNADVCGGGTLFDLGPHVLDLCRHLCGRIKTVSGKSQIAFPERKGQDGKPWKTNADEAFYMLCELENGAMGTVTVSKLSTGESDGLTFDLHGTKGALRFSLMDCNYLYFHDTTKSPQPIGGERGWIQIACVGRYPEPGGAFPSPKAPSGWLRGHAQQLYAFFDALTEQKEFHPDFNDTFEVQAVMEAAELSSENQSRQIEVDYR